MFSSNNECIYIFYCALFILIHAKPYQQPLPLHTNTNCTVYVIHCTV